MIERFQVRTQVGMYLFMMFVARLPTLQSLRLSDDSDPQIGRNPDKAARARAFNAFPIPSEPESVQFLGPYIQVSVDKEGNELLSSTEAFRPLQLSSKCNTTVWWLHPPKTGTGFKNSADLCKRTPGRSPRAAHQNLPRNATDKLLSTVVTIMRHPAARLLSAYHWMKRTRCICCKDDWGWNSGVGWRVRLKICGPASRRIEVGLNTTHEYSPSEAIGKFGGCQTNMITGQAGCMDGQEVPRERIQEAKRRLSKFLFVGLIEHWDLSICLYNYITTGERTFQSFQLTNTRPTDGIGSGHYNISEVPQDHADLEVYAAAVARFHGDITKYNITKNNCPVVK
eukprot:gnl/TRDRNA2_/TRDRNA2_161791_c1_seq5.p1 gnl/TRDRNA2_/TRDRNA2_161791_c1~~gnl/TRDRNA2_/TRDRNA2_161791_c1_seq5.p1  ORF type:complete len:340 (+),score=15.91 gnl/TRDRNA2_/TRDRNA2_161791_c1_seq5:62-1081(+)